MTFSSRTCEGGLPFNSTLDRFDCRYWSIDYPLTAIGTIVSNDPHNLDVYTEHRSNRDLVGLIWNSMDVFGHQSLQYEYKTDYTGAKVAFQANLPDQFESTITLNNQDVIRIYPYQKNGDLLSPVPHGSKYPENPPPSYNYSQVTNDPATPSGDYWYIIDFDNLRKGYNMDEGLVSPIGILSVFLSIITNDYSLGVNAMLRDEGSFSTSGAKTVDLDYLTFINTTPNLVLTRGDVINFDMGVAKAEQSGKGVEWTFDSTPMSMGVDEWRRLDETTVQVKLVDTQYGMAFLGGRATAGGLKTDTAIGNTTVNLRVRNLYASGDNLLQKRDYPDPAHSLQMTSGFDDTYNITPYRQIEQAWKLGYRGRWTTYMGMSHYFEAYSTIGSDFKVDLDRYTTAPLNNPTVKHLEDLLTRMQSLGYMLTWSTAYEILDSVMPEDWKQMNTAGGPALTGWIPPSSFIQPSNLECLNYLVNVIKHGMSLMQSVGMTPSFQIGEPWWWDGLYSDGMPCIYDPYTQQMYFDETGLQVPTPHIANSIMDIDAPENVYQKPYVEWLRGKLGDSTSYIRDQVLASYPTAEHTLLFFTPQIMNPASSFLTLLNFPEEDWKYPNYSFIQIEDYDWLIDGKMDLNHLTFEAAVEMLEYPVEVVEYFVGFVQYPTQKWVWPNMEQAAYNAFDYGIRRVAVWAYPQVIRDSMLWYDDREHNQPDPWEPTPVRTLVGVDNDLLEPRIFIKVGDDKRLHSGLGERELNGEIYYGMGELGKIGALKENVSMSHGGWDLFLIGIPSNLYPDVIERWNGDEVYIWLSVVPGVDPEQVFRGVVEEHTVQPEKGGALKVTLRVKNILSNLDSNESNRYSHNSQLIDYPDDMGLEFVSDLSNQKLNWGV